MENNQCRYFAAIDRNLSELQGARLNRDTLNAMEEADGISHLLLKIIYIAIHNDYMARCMKVFERGEAASFWYIYRTNPQPIDARAKQMGFSVSDFEQIACKLKHIRDKTHFHIDRKGVLDPKAVWSDADLKGIDLSSAVNDVWDLLNHLQLCLKREPKIHDDVDTDLVSRLTQLIEEGRVPR